METTPKRNFADGVALHELPDGGMISGSVGNDDAILRWNTCARILMRNPNLRPKQDEAYDPVVSE